MQRYVKIKLLLVYCLFHAASNSFAQPGTWTAKTNFSGASRAEAIGFSIGAKGYVGLGGGIGTAYNDFWEWDQATNAWTQKANFAGPARFYAVSFSIGSKGYIGTGQIPTPNTYYNDFWEWDQATNTWTAKSNFPGTARLNAVGFSIGAKGYIGTGYNGGTCYQDFYEWDQATDTWIARANFPSVRRDAVGFSIGTKGYIGTGFDGTIQYNDFWEWDQATNAWTAKANFGGAARSEAACFSIGTKGYIGTGVGGVFAFNDFWEWDQATNNWAAKANYGGTARVGVEHAAFSIGCYGYFAVGYIFGILYNDFWEYTPCATALSVTTTSTNILCKGQCIGTATAIPTNGTAPYTYLWHSVGQTTKIATGLCAGIYTVTITDSSASVITTTVTITEPLSVLAASVISSNASCSTLCNGRATVNANGGVPGYIYSWSPSPAQITANATGLCAGNYTCTVTDANGCTDTVSVPINSLPLPIPVITGIDTICEGNSAILNATGGTVYVWSTGATGQTIGIIPSSTAGYTVIASDANGCSANTTFTVTVLPSPVAIAATLPAGQAGNITITQGQSTTLSASGGGTYLWSNGMIDTAITVMPSVTTRYCVTVTDANGCTADSCVTVTVVPIDCSSPGEIYLPNAFSPNQDGENDVLQVYYGNYLCIKDLHLVIYDRWGEKAFESTDPGKVWDGTLKGKVSNTAVFVYYLDVILLNGQQVIRKGNVSLVR